MFAGATGALLAAGAGLLAGDGFAAAASAAAAGVSLSAGFFARVFLVAVLPAAALVSVELSCAEVLPVSAALALALFLERLFLVPVSPAALLSAAILFAPESSPALADFLELFLAVVAPLSAALVSSVASAALLFLEVLFLLALVEPSAAAASWLSPVFFLVLDLAVFDVSAGVSVPFREVSVAAAAFFFFAATTFLVFFAFLAFAFDFFAFFAMFDLPIVWPMVQRSCRHWSERSLQRRRHSAPRRPIDQLDRVDNRDHRPCRDLPDASDIAGGDHVGLYLLDIPDFARAQHLRNVGMQNVVGSGRTTAQMALRHLSHFEAQS